MLRCLLFFLLSILFCLGAFTASAQKNRMPFPASVGADSVHLSTSCGTDVLLAGQRQNPGFKAAEEKMNRAILNYRLADAGVVTLPVVFHIIDDNPSFFSDAQVQAALTDLNNAFSKGGAYAASTGVDTKIRFCLARQAPDGGITTGITRTTSFFANDLNPLIEDARLKNLVQWDPSRYINIWYIRSMHWEIMARFQCGAWLRMYAGGYATMPPGGGPTDGIVVTGLGTMLAHEMGHYLGLYHTFEGLNCQNGDCKTDGDRVCDTPPDASVGNAPACNLPDNSCYSDTLSGFTVDVPDDIANFMDYGNESCHNKFTQGQADRMQAAIATQRSGLLENKCDPPCTESIVALFTRSNPYPLPEDAINFTNGSTGAASYQWLVNGTVAGTATDFSTSFAAPGNYKVTLKAFNGGSCFASFSHDVIVTCGVTARFYTDKREIASLTPKYLDSIRFTNTSVGAATYQWLMRNDKGMAEQVISTAKDFVYVFNTPANYTVRLVATNGGCADTTALYFIPVSDPLPDGTLWITAADCYQETKVRVSFFVCNNGFGPIPEKTPVTFYDGDPRNASAKKLGTFLLPAQIPGLCCGWLYTAIFDVGYRKLNTLYGVFNDSGTSRPLVLPNTPLDEKNYQNNLYSLSNFAFRASATPPVSVLEWGDTLQLRAQAGPTPVSAYSWTPAKNLSCSSCAAPRLVADSTTGKQVVVTSQYGCTDTAKVAIQVPPYNDFNLVLDELQCAAGDSLFVRFTIRNSFKRAVIPKGLPVAFYKDDPTGSTAVFLPKLFVVPDTVKAAAATFTTIIKGRVSPGKVYGVVNDSGKILPPALPAGFPEKDYSGNYASLIYDKFRVQPTPLTATLEWGDTLQLSATAGPGTAQSITWSPAPNLTCTACPSPLLVADTTTTKRVVASSNLGCADTAAVAISVPPYNDFSARINAVQCARGDSLYVSFTLTNSFKRPFLPRGLSLAFYNSDPSLPGAQLLKPLFTLPDTLFVGSASFSTLIKGMPAGTLYAVVNDSAKSLPLKFPATGLLEKSYSNNLLSFSYKPEALVLQPADTTVFRKSRFALQLKTPVYNPASTLWQVGGGNALSCAACASPLLAVYENATVTVQTENRYGCLLKGSTTVKIFPPDFRVTVLDTRCFTNDTALVTFRLCVGNGYDSLWKALPVSFYNGDPAQGGTKLLPPTFRTTQTAPDSCAVFTAKVLAPLTKQLFAVVNDKGDNRALVPSPAFAETNLLNNSQPAVYTPFTVSIQPQDTAIDRLSTVQLQSSATGGTIRSYLWTPSAVLSCATCPSPVAAPPYTTEFSLLAQNEAFCTDTAIAIIRTHSQGGIYLPNAFTPNSDGKNEVLYVMAGAEVTVLRSFAVFNRWGQPVFRVQNVPANTPAFGWNGKVGGDAAPPDVYVYYVEVEQRDGKRRSIKGTVTLIR